MKKSKALNVHIARNHPPKVCRKRTFERDLIHESCIKICQQLHDHGFDAWLVGGCIRDLLLGNTPKDFDITTVATPQQIKDIFKRKCHIIGRRFQIAHVYARGVSEPIEVSTLRARQYDDKNRVINPQGRIEKDNVFGQSLEEDSQRRDFTINAIYYHPITDLCIDYTSGIDDINNKVIRSIGKPEKRFLEDPLRMIRAARFRAKNNLCIGDQEIDAIAKCSHQLKNIPAARMLDESRKLFLNGHALASYQNLRKYNLLYTLLPDVDKALNGEKLSFVNKYSQFLEMALRNTDTRIAQKKPVSIPFLFAALLWTDVCSQQIQRLEEQQKVKKTTHANAKRTNPKVQLYREVCMRQRDTIRLSKIWIMQIIDIWLAHEKLAFHFLNQGNERQAQSLLNREKFRAAYDFLCLRVESGEAPEYKEAAQWWTQRQL